MQLQGNRGYKPTFFRHELPICWSYVFGLGEFPIFGAQWHLSIKTLLPMAIECQGSVAFPAHCQNSTNIIVKRLFWLNKSLPFQQANRKKKWVFAASRPWKTFWNGLLNFPRFSKTWLSTTPFRQKVIKEKSLHFLRKKIRFLDRFSGCCSLCPSVDSYLSRSGRRLLICGAKKQKQRQVH